MVETASRLEIPTAEEFGAAFARVISRAGGPGRSPSSIARELGYDESTLTRIAKGQRYPTVPQLYELAGILGVRVTAVFDDLEDTRLALRIAENRPETAMPDDEALISQVETGLGRGFVALGEILRRLRARTPQP